MFQLVSIALLSAFLALAAVQTGTFCLISMDGKHILISCVVKHSPSAARTMPRVRELEFHTDSLVPNDFSNVFRRTRQYRLPSG